MDLSTLIQLQAGGPGSGRHKDMTSLYDLHDAIRRTPDSGTREQYSRQKMTLEKLFNKAISIDPKAKDLRSAKVNLDKADQYAVEGDHKMATIYQDTALSQIHRWMDATTGVPHGWVRTSLFAGGPGSGCRGDQCGRPKGKGKKEKDPAKQAAAKASYNPTNAKEKRYSASQEVALAEHVGGQHWGGNKPFDVLIPGKAFVELKVKPPGKVSKNSITIHPKSRMNKIKLMKKFGIGSFTVSFDDRQGQQNRKIYWCYGLCYRYKSMNAASSMEELRGILTRGASLKDSLSKGKKK